MYLILLAILGSCSDSSEESSPSLEESNMAQGSEEGSIVSRLSDLDSIQVYVRHVDSLKLVGAMDTIELPNMSPTGGAVSAYVQNETVSLISTVYGGMFGAKWFDYYVHFDNLVYVREEIEYVQGEAYTQEYELAHTDGRGNIDLSLLPLAKHYRIDLAYPPNGPVLINIYDTLNSIGDTSLNYLDSLYRERFKVHCRELGLDHL